MFETRIVNSEFGISFRRNAAGDLEQTKNNIIVLTIPALEVAAFLVDLEVLSQSEGDFEVRLVSDTVPPVSFVLRDEGGVPVYTEERAGAVLFSTDSAGLTVLFDLIEATWPDPA